MSAAVSQPAQVRWCDVEGAHISLFSWVELIGMPPQLLRPLADEPGKS